MTSAAAFRGKGDPGSGHGGVLRDATAEVIRANTDESPGIKSKMDDAAEAVAAVMRDLISELPRMRRSGRTDVSNLSLSVNALTPVSQLMGRRRLERFPTAPRALHPFGSGGKWVGWHGQSFIGGIVSPTEAADQ